MSKAPETIYLQSKDWELPWSIVRTTDADVSYVRADIAYGYASEVERLKVALATLHGRPFSERVYEALHSRMTTAEERVASLEKVLRHLQHHCWGMSTHGIETMARDALTKEG